MQEETKNSKAILPLFLTVLLDMIGIGIVIPIAAQLFINPQYAMFSAETSYADRSIALGFLMASYSLAQFFGAPILGALSDNYGRKPILTMSLIGTGLGYVLFAIGIYEKSITMCFISRIIDGFTGGNISVAMSAISDLSTKANKAKNFGKIGMAFGIGFVIGPYIGGKLADSSILSWFTFATPYWFAAGLSFCNLLLIQFNFKESIHQKTATPVSMFSGIKNIKEAILTPGVNVLFLVVFLITFGFTSFTQFFQVFTMAKFNFTASNSADLFAYVGLWIALTQGLITGLLSRKYAPPTVLKFTILILSLALPVLLIPNQSYILFFIIPFIAMAQGLTQPNLSVLVSMQAGPESQGKIFGINQSLASLAMAIPPIVAGYTNSINNNLPILTAGFTIFIGWFVFITFYKGKPKPLAAAAVQIEH
jgi:DHA1 family tetracycline resistance protein-like MFS transporter